MTYPKKEKILSKNPNIKSVTIVSTLIWKKNYLKKWKTISKKEKFKRLFILIQWLNEVNKNNDLNIKYGNEYQYYYTTKTIYVDKNNPSIISSLHELAHHLFGDSELSACRWSVWLFKECFPGLYKNLKWDKHLLIKK